MIEDIFQENLVDDPDDIERVIEDGEEYRRNSDGESNEEENKKEEEKKEKEKPKIRKATGPRPVLNAQRLTGPRGLASMEEFFSGIKLYGQRGTEEKDLDVFMKRLELWTHRLYPRGQFDDCIKKIENLGSKKLVRNYLTRIRLGMEDGSGQSDIVREEPDSPPHVTSTSPSDPFDDLVSSTTRPTLTAGPVVELTAEQRERMLMNRLIAEERRAARIKRAQELKAKCLAAQASKTETLKPPPGSQTDTTEQENRVENSQMNNNSPPVNSEELQKTSATISGEVSLAERQPLSQAMHLDDQGGKRNSAKVNERQQPSEAMHFEEEGGQRNSAEVKERQQLSETMHLDEEGDQRNSAEVNKRQQLSEVMHLDEKGDQRNSAEVNERQQLSEAMHLDEEGGQRNSAEVNERQQLSEAMHLDDQGGQRNSAEVNGDSSRNCERLSVGEEIQFCVTSSTEEGNTLKKQKVGGSEVDSVEKENDNSN